MKRSISILGAIVLFGCSTNELVLPETDSIIVVEGSVTDLRSRQTIEVKSTVQYGSEFNSAPVMDAQVTVWGSDGSVSRYIHLNNGIYESDQEFEGTYGTSYSLELILEDGTTIRSLEETMPNEAIIDSIWFDQLEEVVPEDEEIVFYPVISSRDEASEENYYRYKLYRNGEWLSEPEFIFLQNDRFFQGKSFREEFRQVEFFETQLATVELIKISRDAHEFYRLLKDQTTAVGTNVGSAPAPIIGNLFNESDPDQEVLGFFAVISTKSAQILINP